MAEHLSSSRFAKVPKVIQAIELVYLPKRLAIFLSKGAQDGPGWSATMPKPVIAFKTKTTKQASQIVVQYLMQLVQQGHRFPVAKHMAQFTTVSREQPVSEEEDDEEEGPEIDPRTKLVRKLFLQALRAAEQEKTEAVEESALAEDLTAEQGQQLVKKHLPKDSQARFYGKATEEGTMGHSHLRRMVEANEQEQCMKNDPLHTFRVLSGLRSMIPRSRS
jgi:hypothetical protein